MLSLIGCPFHPRVTAVARKRSRSLCEKNRWQVAKSADGRLYLKTHTPLTQQSRSGLTMPLSRHSVGTLSGNELTRNTWSQSSHLAEPLWTNLGLKSESSVHKLNSTLKKKKRRKKKSTGGKGTVEHSPKILACEEKAITSRSSSSSSSSSISGGGGGGGSSSSIGSSSGGSGSCGDGGGGGSSCSGSSSSSSSSSNSILESKINGI